MNQGEQEEALQYATLAVQVASKTGTGPEQRLGSVEPVLRRRCVCVSSRCACE